MWKFKIQLKYPSKVAVHTVLKCKTISSCPAIFLPSCFLFFFYCICFPRPFSIVVHISRRFVSVYTPRGSSLYSFFWPNKCAFLSFHCHFLCSRPEATSRNILATVRERGSGEVVLLNLPDNALAVLSSGAQPAWPMANKPQSKRSKLRLSHSICTKLVEEKLLHSSCSCCTLHN